MSAELPLGGSRLVPKGWTLYSVDEIKSKEKYACVAGPFGSSISSKYFTEEGVPIIRGSNLKDDLTRFVSHDFAFVSEEQAKNYPSQHVRGGDLVFTCWGTIGQVGIIPEDGPYPEYIISNKQLKLRVNPEIADSLFVYYYLASREGVEHIRSRAIGSAVPGINLGILKSLTLALPPLVIQQRITEILSNYDRLIDNNTRRIALLEESIHRLYQEWFVYLRFPGCDRVAIVDGVPEGWKRITAEQAIDFKPKTSALKGVERPFVPMDSLSTNLMTIAEIDLRPVGGGAKFRNGDTLLARITPCLENGKTAFVQFMDDPVMVASGSTEFIVMRSKQVTPYWVYCLGRSYNFRQHAINSMAGSDGRQRVKPEALEQFELLLPPSPILKKFDEIASPTFRQIQLLNSQTQKLREARDLLLPRLMNGSLAV